MKQEKIVPVYGDEVDNVALHFGEQPKDARIIAWTHASDNLGYFDGECVLNIGITRLDDGRYAYLYEKDEGGQYGKIISEKYAMNHVLASEKWDEILRTSEFAELRSIYLSDKDQYDIAVCGEPRFFYWKKRKENE